MKFKLILVSFLLSFNHYLFADIAAGTLVEKAFSYVPVEQLHEGDLVECCDLQGQAFVRKIIKIDSYLSSRTVGILIGNQEIITSLDQLFYLPLEKKWKAAQDLEIGNLVQKGINDLAVVDNVFCSISSVELYKVKVEEYHNFFITRDSILVHNHPGLAIPIIVEGPAIINSAVTIGTAVISYLGFRFFAKKRRHADEDKKDERKGYNDMQDDAQAPGMPTEKDGYEPPKNWDGKKVKNPNGHGYGYPDKKGRVWIPTGPKAHRGPHWDVQNPDGTYDNILPGGKIV